VVVASAVIPTFIAQKWFMPAHSEDLVDINNGNGKNSNGILLGDIIGEQAEVERE
jgi:hypothetical protein